MRRDALAGISVAGLLLPSAIAYAAIAGLAPEHAIIATIIGLGVYALVGRSRFAMVAPTSSSAAILAALILAMQREMPQGAEVAEAAVLLAGGCFLAAAALRAGALASFISRPVLGGFSFGIALTITIRQIPAIAGVHVTSPSSGGVLPMVGRLVLSVPQWSPVSVGVGVVALGALTVMRRVRGLPASAMVLAAGVVVSALVDLKSYHVALVGKLGLGLPHPGLPALSFDDWGRILQLSLPLFLILFAESWGSIRSLGIAQRRQGGGQPGIASVGLRECRLGAVSGDAGGGGVFGLLGGRGGGSEDAAGRGRGDGGAAGVEPVG